MKKVLVVDDNYGNRFTLTALLEGEGFFVETAASFREASDRVTSAGEPYDIVVLDYHLGDREGTVLVPVVREHMPEAKVVLLSGSVSEEQARGAVLVDAFMSKGIAFPEMLDLLKAQRWV